MAARRGIMPLLVATTVGVLSSYYTLNPLFREEARKREAMAQQIQKQGEGVQKEESSQSTGMTDLEGSKSTATDS